MIDKYMLNEISNLPMNIEKDLQRNVSQLMDRSQLFYRVFARTKSAASVKHKFIEHIVKGDLYGENKKMQDLVGARIALYFKDDIEICRRLIEDTYEVVDISVDIEDRTNFKPMRLNYVCRLPQEVKELFTSEFFDKYPIDDTFELQIRTVFSEGWHEIEHDLRYKCKEDWYDEDELWRTMNGIFATLETCDWLILALFDQLTYKMYKASNWEGMLRNKFRIRFVSGNLSDELKNLFSENKTIAKEFLKLDRERLMQEVSSKKWSSLPKTMNNIIFIANIVFVKNNALYRVTPEYIWDVIKQEAPYFVEKAFELIP